MQFIFTIMLTAMLGLSLLQCEKPSIGGKSETAKNNPNVSTAPTATAKPDAPAADAHTDDAPRINLEDAKKDFDAGRLVIIDTRAEVAYKTEHIKGAINIPAEGFKTRYKEVPKGKKIIAYCS